MARAGKRRRSKASRPYRCNATRRLVRNRSALLETINGFYAAALDRLPLAEMPALAPRLLKAGLCVGFSDPVSNIILNTVSSCKPAVVVTPDSDEASSKAAVAAKRRRRRALSRAVADTGGVKHWPPFRPLLRDMPVAARSLEALVAFLTYHFRYLPVSEALEYLRLARADALAAARLIIDDRNLSASAGFSLASRTTRTALKCAAIAAFHPNPRALVNTSRSFASRMEQASQLLAADGAGGGLSCAAVETIHGLLRRKLRRLTGVTPPQFDLELTRPPPFVPTKSLQSVLLDRVYEFYLNALARLPAAGLRRRYHRSLLKAGHCYGPFKDPVSNIVLNTVWYETVFPPQEEVSVAAMICSRSLVLVACRSVRGLVAYFRACFDTVSEHQAMRYLLFAEVDLWGAIEMARREGHGERITVTVVEESACRAAATAAMHPDPDAVVNFLVTTFPGLPLSLQTEPMALDVQLISQMLMQYCSIPPGAVQTVPELSEGGYKVLSHIQSDFKEEESFVHAKVNAALKKYTQQTGGPAYELHVICGLNRNVGNSFVWGLHYGPGHMHPRKTQYSHINFLASPTDSHSSDAVPMLFFAECSNDEAVNDESSCWPVMGHPATGRCFYCENEGAKVIHPDSEKYNACDIAFERMACENLGGLTVDDSGDRLITGSVDTCEEDCICFDANKDTKCAEFLNARARTMQGPILA
ncbi:unnamed protein product [Urochloa humidicola]